MNRFAIQIVIQEAIRCLYYVEFLPMFPECLLPGSWYGCTECFVREILAPVLASSSEHYVILHPDYTTTLPGTV